MKEIELKELGYGEFALVTEPEMYEGYLVTKVKCFDCDRHHFPMLNAPNVPNGWGEGVGKIKVLVLDLEILPHRLKEVFNDG